MSNPNSKCDHMANPPCKNQHAQKPPKTSRAMSHSAWEGHSNEKKFMNALTNLMNESWTVVCQMREKSGLNAQYQMSSTEISKRIDEVSKKLEVKYKEVAALEQHKSKLLNKTAKVSSASASVKTRQQQGYPPRPTTGISYGAVGARSTPYGASLPPSGAYGALLPPSGGYGAGFPPSAAQKRRPPPTGGPERGANCRPDCQGSSRSSPGANRTY